MRGIRQSELMPDALIGSTGFVGGNLLRQRPFDDCFHSTDIETIRGRSYDLVVCAGARAEKWLANREPERDRAGIDRLTSCLAEVRAAHVVLISTVDVYPSPVLVDEDSPIDPAAASAYGRHRFALEEFVRGRFDATIVRLPGLFGHGLKKNVIYDLLHHNALDAVCPDSVYQFYGLDRMWHDIETTRAHRLAIVNLATEPVSVRDLAREAFGVAFENPAQTSAARYDMRTRHSALFGGSGGYVTSRTDVLHAIRAFVSQSRQGIA
jgi:nucleoside-diphosphate-sugar epimerase